MTTKSIWMQEIIRFFFSGYGDDGIWVGYGANAWEQDKPVNTEHSSMTDFAIGEDKIILDGVTSSDSILSMQAYSNIGLIDVLDDFI